MTLIRLDPHAHLYDSYPLRAWCDAACTNLGHGEGVSAVVIVVDRAGQDSFARFRQEGVSFGVWREASVRPLDGVSEVGTFSWEGRILHIIRGVQYVSVEKIEVLGLGVGRSVPDGAPASELIDLIRQEDGVACLPWSPGKWLGERGHVIVKLMRSFSPSSLTFGDIAIRSSYGPPSLLLRRAQRRNFPILYGTDPLPGGSDVSLVGSFGVQFSANAHGTPEGIFAESIRPALLDPECLRIWGKRNDPLLALKRFFRSSRESRIPA